jgi:hypothetical protein
VSQATVLGSVVGLSRRSCSIRAKSQRAYIEVLGIALAHELMRLNEGCAALEADQHGGLPGWQR